MELPTGKRHDDPPEQGFRFRIGLAIARYPVLAATTAALIVATIALWLVLGAQDDLKTEKASRTSVKLAAISLCGQLQSERRRANVTAAVVYLTLASAAQREEQLAGLSRAPEIHRKSARIGHLLAATATYAPPYHCERAIDDPEHFRPPVTRAFTPKLAARILPEIARLLKEARP